MTENTEPWIRNDPRLGLITVSILDRIYPVIEMARQFHQENDPDVDDASATHWFNGMLYGVVAMYATAAKGDDGIEPAEVRKLYKVVCEAFEEMVAGDGLDTFVDEMLAKEGVAIDDEGNVTRLDGGEEVAHA